MYENIGKVNFLSFESHYVYMSFTCDFMHAAVCSSARQQIQKKKKKKKKKLIPKL